MAVATATALAIGGLAISAATTTKSFIDANNQKKLQKEAEQDAKNAMDAARKKLEVNFFDQMAVKKEPYELEREAMLAQGAQAIQAGQEQERGAAATAGRVQMAMNEGQAGIRTAMGKEMTDIEKMQLAEESRLRDVGVQLDLGEVEGAQLAARDAQQAAAAATAQGWEGVASTAQQGLAMVPLYTQNASAQKSALGKMNMSTEEFQKFGNVGGKSMGAAGTDGFTNLDFGAIPNMSNSQFRQFKRDLTPQQRQSLFTNQQYLNNYNPFQAY
jgi:hypothetical protein